MRDTLGYKAKRTNLERDNEPEKLRKRYNLRILCIYKEIVFVAIAFLQCIANKRVIQNGAKMSF